MVVTLRSAAADGIGTVLHGFEFQATRTAPSGIRTALVGPELGIHSEQRSVS